MKLVTFEKDDRENFGFIIEFPQSDAVWVIEPGKAEAMIRAYAVSKTSGYQFSIPEFSADFSWPAQLVEFLQMGDKAIQSLRKLEQFVLRFVEQSDAYALLAKAGHPLSAVKLLAPIPAPGLLWGLVGNNPAFSRNHMEIRHINLIPQAHQRHRCSVIGDGEPFVFRRIPEFTSWSYNVELGVVIGKECRNVTPGQAMDYVAGYTVISDINHDYYYNRYPEMLRHKDPYSIMAYGWTGKNTDFTCAMGPWLVTKDEVGHPYDLDVAVRMNGILRDHANTCSMLIGIERTIAYYSSFATLYPGDVIHMGADGKDGLATDPSLCISDGQQVTECEIEKVGVLRNPVVYDGEDIDPSEIPQRNLPLLARRLIASGQTSIAADDWNVHKARNFLITYGNYASVKEQEGYEPCAIPRYMWAPVGALGSGDDVLTSPSMESDLCLSMEVAVVIRDLIKWKDRDQAEKYILGYVPMLSGFDTHLADEVIQPALPREWAMASVYTRWSDKCNITGNIITAMTEDEAANLEMRLYVDEELKLTENSKTYICKAPQLIEMLTFGATLLPGDLLTLGRVGAVCRIPAKERSNEPHRVVLKITGLPELACRVR